MKRLLLLAAVLALVTPAIPQAAEETWKGTLSDSMCGTKHAAEKHAGKGDDHRACVLRCVDRGGEYVFLSGDKTLKIANQSFESLKAHAGHEVMLTGELKDGAITVSKIEMPKTEKK